MELPCSSEMVVHVSSLLQGWHMSTQSASKVSQDGTDLSCHDWPLCCAVHSSTDTCALLCSSAAACKSRPTHMLGCWHSLEPARGWWHLCRERQGRSSCCRSAIFNACVPAPAAKAQQPSNDKLNVSAPGPVQQLLDELSCLLPGLLGQFIGCSMWH